MQNHPTIPLWKKAPFIRLLVPMMGGIILEWYLQFSLLLIVTSSVGFIVSWLLFLLFSPGTRFRLQGIQGLILNLLIMCLGLLITFQQDVRNKEDWYGKYYLPGDLMVVKLEEPLIQKAKSFKANGSVEAIIRDKRTIKCMGKVLLYFSKTGARDTMRPMHAQLKYGDKILINKSPEQIKNSGNPGAFNYERYAAFQQVFQNVFLKESDWVETGMQDPGSFKKFIFTARDNILLALRKNIGSGGDELGLAEALLIGYTNDLDKDLVQAYSNTGVVHIIAISGMHLALIYLLLVKIFEKIPFLNRSKLLQVIAILSCLWTFSLLTGASASVIRAAVMFTFITVGTNLQKRSSIYNSLAASAFVILCYNSYFLWDVGFQLSYLAVISIIVFQKPVHNWLYLKNKWAEKLWELMAISLAAQILTFPVCIYYFHQFPNYFLLANIIAVPLSSLILYAEIALVILSHMPFFGLIAGKVVTWLVWLMNQVVLWVNELPFALWENIPASVVSTWLLYGIIVGTAAWLINKNQHLLYLALVCLLTFMLLFSYEKWQITNRQKLIVYNIAQHQAMDFIDGNDLYFVGDRIFLTDRMLRNFSLKPARIALQAGNSTAHLKSLFNQAPFYQFNNKRILLIDGPMPFTSSGQLFTIDVIIISKNSPVNVAQLTDVFNCAQYIFDASNSLWKIDKWQKECEELHLRSYSIPHNGAFILAAGN